MAYFTVLNESKVLETFKKSKVMTIAEKRLLNFAFVALLALLVKYGAEYCAEELKQNNLCNNAEQTQQESILCQTEQSNYRTK